jgi:hypothetical protein
VNNMNFMCANRYLKSDRIVFGTEFIMPTVLPSKTSRFSRKAHISLEGCNSQRGRFVCTFSWALTFSKCSYQFESLRAVIIVLFTKGKQPESVVIQFICNTVLISLDKLFQIHSEWSERRTSFISITFHLSFEHAVLKEKEAKRRRGNRYWMAQNRF